MVNARTRQRKYYRERQFKASHLLSSLTKRTWTILLILAMSIIAVTTIYTHPRRFFSHPVKGSHQKQTKTGSELLSARTETLSSNANSNDQASTKHQTTKIGKLSMLYGDANPYYERAIAAHTSHNERFGYEFHVLREKTMPSHWSRPAYILQHLLSELAKPATDRLEWLVWFDTDTVLMNPKIPLEIFLPPSNDWSHINALVTNDNRGLHAGVFFLRVTVWSVWLMNACLGTETFAPDLQVSSGDQAALMYWLNSDRFRRNTIHVPERWFNAHAGFRGDPSSTFADPNQPQYKFRSDSIREGDLLVHQSGQKALRAKGMGPWLDIAEQHSAAWELEPEQTTYGREIERFWSSDAPHEHKMVDELNAKLAAKGTDRKVQVASSVARTGKVSRRRTRR